VLHKKIVDGILTTKKLTVTDGASSATTGYVLTQLDEDGRAGWVYNSPTSGSTGGYWVSGSSGTNSIRVTNGGGADATGDYAVATGFLSTASGNYSHVGGFQNTASGDFSQAQGYRTVASGDYSHTEGKDNEATGSTSHAEGLGTKAHGDNSHAEGAGSISTGTNSHAGGIDSEASGITSFIHSTNSIVTGNRSAILGGQNITGTTDDTVYVPNLNIGTIGTGTSINNLGIDVSGNVVTGTSSGGATIDPYECVGNSSGNITWDVSGTSTNYDVTLTGNTTLNLINVRNGDYGTIIVKQDPVGSHTLSFGTVNGGAANHYVVNGGAGSPTLTATANSVDILSFTYGLSCPDGDEQAFWTVGNDYT